MGWGRSQQAVCRARPVLRGEGDWECSCVDGNSAVSIGLREQFTIMDIFCESN